MDYHEQLYGNKFDNLGKMDNFLERHKPLKLTEDIIEKSVQTNIL